MLKKIIIASCVSLSLLSTVAYAAPKHHRVAHAQKTEQKINVNKATAKQLIALKGVGKTLAARIVAYRDNNGKFKNLTDLLKIKGINQNKLNKFKANATIG